MDVRKATAVVEVAESATSAVFGRDAQNPAVCVVDGHGVKVTTSSGRLVLSDGVGRHRRERVYSRATHGLARLVVVATTGNITVDALRWLEGAGVGLIVLDPSTGRVVTASTRVANDDARLRRAQALAPGTETGLLIVRCLIEAKLTGQSEIAATELNAPGVAERILVLRGMVADSASLEAVSYTHLDVYKRQLPPNDRRRNGPRQPAGRRPDARSLVGSRSDGVRQYVVPPW